MTEQEPWEHRLAWESLGGTPGTQQTAAQPKAAQSIWGSPRPSPLCHTDEMDQPPKEGTSSCAAAAAQSTRA